jgi:hypothetical protein
MEAVEQALKDIAREQQIERLVALFRKLQE